MRPAGRRTAGRSLTGLLGAAVLIVATIVGVARALTLLHRPADGLRALPLLTVTPDSGSHTATVHIPLGGDSGASVAVRVPVIEQAPGTVANDLRAAGAGAASVSVGAPMSGAPPVPPGFVGLSIEDQALPIYAAEGPLFAQLLGNLSPGTRPIIRFGGDSGDHAYIPGPGLHDPGLSVPLSPSWLAALSRFSHLTRARFVMGLDLESVDQPAVPVAEARAFQNALGSALLAFEPGNEPDLYTVFPWYVGSKQELVYARPSSWSPNGYVRELRQIAPALGNEPVWGPSFDIGSKWWNSIGPIAGALGHLTTVTDHSYATNCYVVHSSIHWPTVPHLIAPSASAGLVSEMEPALSFARRTGRAFRVDETNTVSCAGTQSLSGVANAIWPIQAGFNFASSGISGVNIESNPAAMTRLFSFGSLSVQKAENAQLAQLTQGAQSGQGVRTAPVPAGPQPVSVSDEYYGWMLFARAAPAGARLLSVNTAGNSWVLAYGARTGSEVNVVLVNESPSVSATVSLSGTGGSLAVVQPLRGAGLSLSGGMSLDGMSVGGRSGQLSGRAHVSVLGGDGRFVVSLPPASVDLVTVTR